MRKSEYPIGSFLTTVEYGHTFIHDGTENGSAYEFARQLKEGGEK